MSDVVGQIALELNVDAAKFKQQLKSIGKTAEQSTSGLKASFGKLGGAIAVAFSVKAITSFAKECLQLGSDLAEVQNVVDVTFGNMSGAVNDFAKDALKSYGMSEAVAKKYMGQFGAMSKAFGNTEAMAYDQAAALTGLAGDVASFYNMSTDEAFTKLKAVYTGETESLKELGIVMTQSALDSYALQQGFGKTTSEMSEQEKVALRLSFVQSRLADASGDFARTSDGWANQTRVLALQFDALKATLGQGLINVLTPIVQWLNIIIERLQVAAQAFHDFTVRVFGDAGGSSGSLETTVANSEALSNNMGSATKAAKEYKKVIAGFDKLNILGSESGGGSGGGAGGMVSNPFESLTGGGGDSGSGYDTAAMQETLAEIATIVGAATLALGAILAFTGVNLGLGISLMALGAAELATAATIDATLLEGDVRSGLDLITVAVGGASLAIGAILTISGVNMGLGIALLAIGAVTIATEAALDWNAGYNKISGIIADIESAVGGGLLALGAFLAFSNINVGLGIALMAAGALSLAAAAKVQWGDPENGVTNTITTIGTAVGGAFLALGALLAFSGVQVPVGISLMATGAAALVTTVLPNWEGLSDKTRDVISIVTTSVSTALLALGAILAFSGVKIELGIALMAAGAVGLVATIAPNWNNMSDETQKTITLITGIAGGALLALGVILCCCGIYPLGIGLIVAGAGSLAAAIAPNWDAITDKVKSICEKIGEFFSNLWDGIISGLKGFVNIFIDALNWIIRGLNKISFSIPSWVPGVGGKTFGINIAEIPRLATGGYVEANTPQLAIVGDNKREGEIIAPESKIAEAVARGFAMVMSKMQTQNGPQNERPIYLTVQLGEDTFWEGFVDYHNDIVKRTGDSPLLV